MLASGHEGMTTVIALAHEFYTIHGIEINSKKTELLTINSTHDGPLKFGNDWIQPHPASKASRMLGVWISGDGTTKGTKNIVLKETEDICSALDRKAITDKQCVYIINSVLIPRLLYRITTAAMSDTTINNIIKRYCGVLKRKLGLPFSTPNSILHHTRLYGARNLRDALAEEQISTLWLRANAGDIVGKLTHCRLQALQEAAILFESPLQAPAIACRYQRHNHIAYVCKLMVERNITFQDLRDRHERVQLSKILEPELYKELAKKLKEHDIRYMDQIMDTTTLKTIPWRQIKPNNHPQVFYIKLCQAISTFPERTAQEVVNGIVSIGTQENNGAEPSQPLATQGETTVETVSTTGTQRGAGSRAVTEDMRLLESPDGPLPPSTTDTNIDVNQRQILRDPT
ncbi:hypothetical protein BGZ70_005506, partial [Mortierella alpina]